MTTTPISSDVVLLLIVKTNLRTKAMWLMVDGDDDDDDEGDRK